MERLVLSLPHKSALPEAGKKRFILAAGYVCLALNPLGLLYGIPPLVGVAAAAVLFAAMLFLGGVFCRGESIKGLVKAAFWAFFVVGILFFQQASPLGVQLGERVWFLLLLTQPLLAIYDTLQLIKGRASLYFHLKAS